MVGRFAGERTGAPDRIQMSRGKRSREQKPVMVAQCVYRLQPDAARRYARQSGVILSVRSLPLRDPALLYEPNE